MKRFSFLDTLSISGEGYSGPGDIYNFIKEVCN